MENYIPKPKGAKIVIAEYESGVSDPAEIAKRTGYKISTVCDYLNRYKTGVKVRMERHKGFYISEKTKRIITALKAGKSPMQIARDERVSRQRVYYTRKKYLERTDMEEKKLTDEEIVKSLEHCGSQHHIKGCKDCPMKGIEDCYDEPLPKCEECGAFVWNAKPLKEL